MSTEIIELNHDRQMVVHGLDDKIIFKALTKLTLIQQKLFLLLSTQVNKEDDEFGFYYINIDQLVAYTGMSKRYVKENMDKILEDMESIKLVYLEVDEKTGEKIKKRRLSVIGDETGITYNDPRGKGIYANISDKMKPYMLNLSKNFVKYQLEYGIHFKKELSLPIYEYMKNKISIATNGKQEEGLKTSFTIAFEQFKEDLGQDNNYPRFGDYKIKVLNVCLQEINARTDITVDFSPLKTGKKITHIKFDIMYKANAIPQEVEKKTKAKKVTYRCRETKKPITKKFYDEMYDLLGKEQVEKLYEKVEG